MRTQDDQATCAIDCTTNLVVASRACTHKLRYFGNRLISALLSGDHAATASVRPLRADFRRRLALA